MPGKPCGGETIAAAPRTRIQEHPEPRGLLFCVAKVVQPSAGCGPQADNRPQHPSSCTLPKV